MQHFDDSVVLLKKVNSQPCQLGSNDQTEVTLYIVIIPSYSERS